MTVSTANDSKISIDFYQSEDVVALARKLLGKKLYTSINGEITAGIITETEAYRSWGDKACHANNNKRTARTEVMFSPGGVSYVYLCYGIHHLFNIVTNVKDKAEAVLIRAVVPAEGIEIMEGRRGRKRNDPKISAGPGNLSKALGITTALNEVDLTGDSIWLKHGTVVQQEIVATTRIGVDFAEEDAQHPWRFYIKDSPYVSCR